MVAQAETLDPASLVARIIEELQENPEAQALLLRALLTNEFLGMPARLGRVEADVAEMKLDIAALKSDVSELKSDVSGLKSDVAGLKSDVAVLKGDGLEAKLHRKARPILSQKFGLRGTQVLHSTLQEMQPELSRPVESALDGGIISDGQDTRIGATDIIIRGQRRGDRTPVWVAVEASNDIGQSDVRRAAESADALRAVFQQDVIAVVMGYRIHPHDQGRADKAGFHVEILSETS